MFKTVTDFIAAESILNHQQEVEAYRRQQLLVSAKRGTWVLEAMQGLCDLNLWLNRQILLDKS